MSSGKKGKVEEEIEGFAQGTKGVVFECSNGGSGRVVGVCRLCVGAFKSEKRCLGSFAARGGL